MNYAAEKETVFSIGDLLAFPDFPTDLKPLTRTEQREILLREIYQFYTAEKDKRRKENWKRYCTWCKTNHFSNTPQNQKSFKKSKMFIKEVSFASLCWLLKHIPLEHLPYFISTGREFAQTGKNFGAWLAMSYERVDK